MITHVLSFTSVLIAVIPPNAFIASWAVSAPSRVYLLTSAKEGRVLRWQGGMGHQACQHITVTESSWSPATALLVSQGTDMGMQKALLLCEIQLKIFIEENSLLILLLCNRSKGIYENCICWQTKRATRSARIVGGMFELRRNCITLCKHENLVNFFICTIYSLILIVITSRCINETLL